MLATILLAAAATRTVFASTSIPATTTLDGVPYTWKGAVAYGELDPNMPDQFGDSFGGVGSAIALKKWKKNADGSFSGTLLMQPDRGHNTVSLENYAARQHSVDVTLRPCTAATCNTDPSSPSLSLTYESSLHYIDTSSRNLNGHLTSGLDAVNVRSPANGFPVLPEVEDGNNALATDMEGLALMPDGSWWSSDEYGPSIYHIGSDGTILSAISPPDAFLPHNSNGALDYSTEGSSTIVSGRTANQGFEGLTVGHDGTRLYVLLQSALLQDQDLTNDVSVQYTRMLVYDISTPSSPSLLEEYVVELPASSSKVFAASELHYVKDGVFLVLARDGKGNGNGDSPSSTASKSQLTANFKNIGLISLAGATNIVGMYDAVGAAVAPNGVLDSAVTPVTFNDFVDIIDDAQLARFGLQNGKPIATDIVGKWESLAIAPVLDPAFPDDYFLFTAADNDFINTHEYVNGQDTGPDPYGTSVPNAVFVYRVTLPNADYPTYLLDQSLNPSGLARRRLPRSNCPPNTEQCSLGLSAYECIDTSSHLEQCGACAADGGVDCTQLEGAIAVECVNGSCVVETCEDGFKLVSGRCH